MQRYQIIKVLAIKVKFVRFLLKISYTYESSALYNPPMHHTYSDRGNLEALMNIGRLRLQYSTIPLCWGSVKNVHLSTFNLYLVECPRGERVMNNVSYWNSGEIIILANGYEQIMFSVVLSWSLYVLEQLLTSHATSNKVKLYIPWTKWEFDWQHLLISRFLGNSI